MSKFLSEKVAVLPWPRMAPDLNLIDHLWGVLKIPVEEKNTQHKLSDPGGADVKLTSYV